MAEIAGDRISYKIDIDGLSKLDGMQRVIKQIDKLMPKLDKSVKGANDSLNKLNADMNKGNTSGLDKDKKHVDAINESLKKTGKAADTTESRTTRLGNSMDKSFGKSFFNRHTRDLGKLGSQMQSFGSKATVVTAGLTAGAAVALKTATQLQNRYKIINNLAVTGGEKSAEVQKNVNQMQRDGTKYSNEYGVATKKIADGYETLVRRGYTSNQALGAQKSYLQGAIASGDSYTDVVNNAASAIEQFGMKVNSVKGMANASKVAINQMAYSADLTATSFGDLGEALKYAGPDAHAANQTLHETVSAIGDLSNFGIWKLSSQLETAA
ncbi:phage tail tape measure protein [Lentilactobacillus sp. SPB1-3]|uniref:Phage tail tape measure protein n=1 Tax=Lentilactobacillus terminaliae TaxID=3003483 RepID=A0ACD5DCK7_9LACO|nr:phage tail tape measure protein [Lentilactobacillus sp. SPB1-3]MCZ0978095.1 phage tail tape measure protein [Lentilactobacillus sp. SPB1-3]